MMGKSSFNIYLPLLYKIIKTIIPVTAAAVFIVQKIGKHLNEPGNTKAVK